MLTPEAIAFVDWTCGIMAVVIVSLAAYGLWTLIRKVLSNKAVTPGPEIRPWSQP